MKSEIKNYKQEKKTGEEKQIVIVENHLTGETDELDPMFERDEDSPAEEINDEDDYFLEEDSSFTPNDESSFPDTEDMRNDH
jgi:hypothetical protein